jgi:hypothetical protein
MQSGIAGHGSTVTRRLIEKEQSEQTWSRLPIQPHSTKPRVGKPAVMGLALCGMGLRSIQDHQK